MKRCPLGLTNYEIDNLLENDEIERCSNCESLKMNNGIIHCEVLDNSVNDDE